MLPMNRRDIREGVFSVNCMLAMLFATVGCDRTSPAPEIPKPAARDAPTVATPNSQGPPEIPLRDQTERWQVDFSYRNGEEAGQCTILESLGGGIGLFDFDLDGYVDLFCPGGGTFKSKTTVGYPGELFRNLGGKQLKPVGSAAGQGFSPRVYNHGAFSADFDADGFDDVLVSGYGGLQLWHNQGDGSFRDVTDEVGLHDESWSSGCAWADFNNDGLLDLYVSHYVDWSFENHPFCQGRTDDERDICPPREYQGLTDTLYLASAEGQFTDVSEQWGLKPQGKGLGVIVADWDANGFVDPYVANDTVNNFLYVSQGKPPFREAAMLSGVATDKAGVPNGSMGLGVLDFDGTGRPDIWVTNYEREDFALYRNEGPTAFLHVSDVAGVNVLGGLFVGFGTVCHDLDLDGDEDILVNNGHVILYPTASPRKQLPLVLENQRGRFQRVSYQPSSYLAQPHEGRGLAIADLDNDGDGDAIYSNINEPVAILENERTSNNHWFQAKLVGTESNRDAIGATVTLSIGDKQWMRVVYGGGSYMSTSQDRLFWGLGNATQIDRLEVRWPSGKVTQIADVQADQLLRIVEADDEQS